MVISAREREREKEREREGQLLLRGDLIQAFQIVNPIDDLESGDFFIIPFFLFSFLLRGRGNGQDRKCSI